MVSESVRCVATPRRSPWADPDNLIPELRPQNRLRGSFVHFLLSRHPQLKLSEAEASLYADIDGRTSVAGLARSHPGAAETLRAWHHAAIIEVLTPFNPPEHPHLVVIEPHMDDAILSVGGSLLARKNRCRITILTVAWKSIFSSYLLSRYDFTDVGEITTLRLRESALAAKLVGAEHRTMAELAEAPLRLCPGEQWAPSLVDAYRSHPQSFVNGMPDPIEVRTVADGLMHELSALRPDELWIPMGLGSHIDHGTVRSACLLMLQRHYKRFSSLPVAMYEDVPYTGLFPHADRVRKSLSDFGSGTDRRVEDITGVFEDKLRAVSVFGTQFKIGAIGPAIRRIAESAANAPGRLAESRYELKRPVGLPPEIAMSWEGPGLDRLRQKIRLLTRRRKACQRMAVIALPSGSMGTWVNTAKALRASLPATNFHLYIAEAIASQMGTKIDPENMNVRYVRGVAGWLGVAGRELFHFRTPTFAIWKGAHAAGPKVLPKKAVNLVIRLLFPWRRHLFARSLREVALFLHEPVIDAEGDDATSLAAARGDSNVPAAIG